jgi:hypothetical protein
MSQRAKGAAPRQKAQVRALARCFTAITPFSRRILKRPLRGYQLAPARAIVDSVLHRRGRTFAVMMARQAGKNETAAQIEAFLLNLYRRRGGFIVKTAPTYRPQILNSMLRLESVVAGSPLAPLEREHGHMLCADRARIAFYSAAPGASVVGATADILLEADEAQDVDPDKWNKDFRPMGASTNTTTVLWGTAWTTRTLLYRTICRLNEAEARDGVRRVFRVPWQDVAAEVPAYGAYVRKEIDRLGLEHPLIRTQYALEEIDDEAGLFGRAVQALMQGAHGRQRVPTAGRTYALLVDVAGEAEDALTGEALREKAPRKDSTALTVVEVSRTAGGLARYLVVDRYYWTGTPHHELAGAIAHLADLWGAYRVVVDATGVGAGLVSFLKRDLGPRLEPFVFTARSKSDLGWAFVGLCSSGRFVDHRDDGSPEYRQFWREVAAADYQILDGPNQRMRWGVADPAVHDDLLISAALCAVLEWSDVAPGGPSQIVEAEDPLAHEDRGARSFGEVTER